MVFQDPYFKQELTQFTRILQKTPKPEERVKQCWDSICFDYKYNIFITKMQNLFHKLS